MKKRTIFSFLIGVSIVVLLIVIPLFIARIIDVRTFSWMPENNDWIGFWGSYLGGILTLFGVLITIIYTKKEEYRKKKLAIRPYISIKDLNYNIQAEELNIIRLGGNLGGLNHEDSYIFIKNISLACRLANVGLGTAVQLYIDDYKIENKNYSMHTDVVGGFCVGDIYTLNLSFTSIHLDKNDATDRFIRESDSLKKQYPDATTLVKVNFSFCIEYKDLLGTRLRQEIVFYNHLSNKFPCTVDSIQHWVIERVGEPQEITSQ